MNKVLSYGRHWINDRDVAAVSRVLRGDCLTQGPLVKKFEARMAEYCGARYAVAFSSGTAALHAATAVAGIGPGDEAITSPLSFVASANCVVFQGARPRFVDVELGGAHLDPGELAKGWNRRVKAVIPVDYAGHPAELQEILTFCRRHGAVVIEDASHSLGASYRGKPVGAWADMTTLSFHPVKTLTTGEGGMVLTKRKKWVDGLRRFREHGIQRSTSKLKKFPWFYQMMELGYNYRLPDILCSLGLSQMERLSGFIRRRRTIARRYDLAFEKIRFLSPLRERPGALSAYHLYAVQIEFSKIGKTRADVMRELRKRGVGSQVHYIPIHFHPFYRSRYGYKPGDFPNAERFYERALSLPLFPKMSDVDVEHVIKAVQEVIGS